MQVSDVTFVTVNYNTPDLLRRLLTSIRRFYPDVAVLVVDGSDRAIYQRRCEKICEEFDAKRDGVGWNIHHGPGLNRGVASSQTEYCVVIDSDVALERPGFIEAAFTALRETDFGVGEIEFVDESGVNVPESEGMPYLHPRLSMWRRSAYLEGPRAIRHGAPLLPVMQNLEASPWTLSALPEIGSYFTELQYGTVQRTGGYHLRGEGERLWPWLARTRRRLVKRRAGMRKQLRRLSRSPRDHESGRR